jgi:hypothetical protein
MTSRLCRGMSLALASVALCAAAYGEVVVEEYAG